MLFVCVCVKGKVAFNSQQQNTVVSPPKCPFRTFVKLIYVSNDRGEGGILNVYSASADVIPLLNTYTYLTYSITEN